MSTTFDINRPAKDPFKVPENYFEEFTKQVMARIPEDDVQTTKVVNVPFWNRVKPYIGVAAVIAIVAVASHAIKKQVPDKDSLKYESVVAQTNNQQSEFDAMYNYMMLDDQSVSDYVDE
ncbi:MAG: hypothetical protein IJS43_02790 [Bacteroidaceae bacterium]|nr:hypothetical protein [Bacteroidaceae bacterium]